MRIRIYLVVPDVAVAAPVTATERGRAATYRGPAAELSHLKKTSAARFWYNHGAGSKLGPDNSSSPEICERPRIEDELWAFITRSSVALRILEMQRSSAPMGSRLHQPTDRKGRQYFQSRR